MAEQRALAKQNTVLAEIRGSLGSDKMKAELERALPKHLPADKLIRVAISALQKTPKLLECDKLSVYKAVMESAQLGLVPDGILGQAYFVPYGKTCQLIVGYRGLQALAVRSGKVSHIYAEVVYSHDEFSYEMGAFPKLRHIPALSDRGEFLCAYAVAHLIDNPAQPAICIMSAADIEAIRKRSAAGNSGPWVTDTDEMRKKCPIRRLCKNLPLSPELVRAAVKGEYAEVGVLDPGPKVDLSKPGLQAFGRPKPVIAEDVTEPDNQREGVASGEPHIEEPPSPTPQGADSAPSRKPLSRREKLMAELRERREGFNMEREEVEKIARGKFGDGCEVVSLTDDQIAELIELVSVEAQTPRGQQGLGF